MVHIYRRELHRLVLLKLETGHNDCRANATELIGRAAVRLHVV